MRTKLKCAQGVVEFVAAANAERGFPVAGMWVKGVAEVVGAAVGFGMGPGGRAPERESKNAFLCVVTVLGFVDKSEAMSSVAEVGPTQSWDFELGFLPAVVASGGTVDCAVRNLVGGVGAGGDEWNRGLQQDVGFVPVDVVGDVDTIEVGVEADVLNEA